MPLLFLQKTYPRRYHSCRKRSYPLAMQTKGEYFLLPCPLFKKITNQHSLIFALQFNLIATSLVHHTTTPHFSNPRFLFLSLSRNLNMTQCKPPLYSPAFVRRNGITVPSNRPTTLAQTQNKLRYQTSSLDSRRRDMHSRTALQAREGEAVTRAEVPRGGLFVETWYWDTK
jgi:hypothetical protein